MTKTRTALLLLMLPLAAACANAPRPMRELPPPAPTSYFSAPVRAGDNLKALADRYKVKEDDLLAMNDFGRGEALKAGSTVRIPAYGLRDVIEPAPKAVAKNNTAPSAAALPRPAPRVAIETRALEAPRTAKPTSQSLKSESPLVASATKPNTAAPAAPEQSWFGNWFSSPQAPADLPAQKFLWPVSGEVISGFGQSGSGQRNDGINISAPRGTPVKAAETGTVTYVGNELKGYGNLVLIQHDNGYVTAYAHADRVTVERGMRVARGQIIAYAGETGDVNRPQVHFEVRYGTRPVDPQPYLVASK